MPLQKQGINISFGQGLDTKSDTFQVQPGNFLELENAVFSKYKQLTKRNGYNILSNLSDASAQVLTTFKNNLVALGSSVQALIPGTSTWATSGTFKPIDLVTQSIVKTSTAQSQADSAIAPNDLVCTVYTDQVTNSSGVNVPTHKYVITDKATGQIVKSPQTLNTNNNAFGAPKVFILGVYFVIAYIKDNPYSLYYVAIPYNNPTTSPTIAQKIGDIVVPTQSDFSSTPPWDGFVLNNVLYFAFNTIASPSNTINLTFITPSLGSAPTPLQIIGERADLISVTGNLLSGIPAVWVTWYDSTNGIIKTGYTLSVAGGSLVGKYTVFANQTNTVKVTNITSLATGTSSSTNKIFIENKNSYSYDANVRSDYITVRYVNESGSVQTGTTIDNLPGSINSFSSLISNLPSTSNLSVGMRVTAVGIPTPSYITQINSSTSVTINTLATTSGNRNFTFGLDTVIRSAGIASKPIELDGITYFLVAYQSTYQPSYFLINSSGSIVAKLAYSNGGGYTVPGAVPSCTLKDAFISVPYLYKSTITAANQNIDIAPNAAAGVYAQLGVNMVTFDLTANNIKSSEIANNLNLTGGFVAAYDGQQITEQGFFVYPDSVKASLGSAVTIANSVTSIGSAIVTLPLGTDLSTIAIGMSVTSLPNNISGKVTSITDTTRTTIAATTTGSNVIQFSGVGTPSIFAYLTVGMAISGSTIAANTVITSIDSINKQVIMSNNAIGGSGDAQIITFGSKTITLSAAATGAGTTTLTLVGSVDVPAVGATTDYYYSATYEWQDAQGNLFRSAPSLPVKVTYNSAVTSKYNIIYIPTLRLTYKISTPVKIVLYRWSTAQQTYYQVTSVTTPVLNNTAVDSVQIIDTYADADIIGNSILYTTGGVLENISPPASSLMTLFNNRLWVLDSENRNSLWFSKPVFESTPVEMSDLMTLYVAPVTASQGSTGVITAMSPMDDKLIIFKKNALGYISGQGPDSTGRYNQYSDFVLINSVVGCDQPQSIVFQPQGLMFQSNQGIWLVARDLSTNYIGAPVEEFTQNATVLSAINVPGTTQVRFTLDSGITLMYDYFFNQWGAFTNIPAISSTVYENLHTYLYSTTSNGQLVARISQETPGQYLDNGSPVLMKFKSAWMNFAGVQGFERFYQMYLLGKYITPFKLNMDIAYNYNPTPQQSTIITPQEYGGTWGSLNLWGSGNTWGNTPDANVFEARLFPQIQKCESFQITMTELFDSSFSTTPGAGLTLSGMNLVVGMKKGYRTSTAAKSFG